jgi:hypothetical protein
MTKAEKLRKLEEIAHQREELNLIENFVNSDNGKSYKWLKAKPKSMQHEVRLLYGKIRVGTETAEHELLALQVEEKTLERLLDLFQNLQERKNELDNEAKIVSNTVESEEVSEPLARRSE